MWPDPHWTVPDIHPMSIQSATLTRHWTHTEYTMGQSLIFCCAVRWLSNEMYSIKKVSPQTRDIEQMSGQCHIRWAITDPELGMFLVFYQLVYCLVLNIWFRVQFTSFILIFN